MHPGLKIVQVARDVQRRRPTVLSPQQPLFHACLMSPYHTHLRNMPATAAAVPSMMSVRERDFLYNLAKDVYAGAGVIVDAGTFLGASTRCFGEGLQANPKRREILAKRTRPVISIERGIVQDAMLNFFKRHRIGEALRPGDSFAPLIEEYIAPIAPTIELRIGDILANGAISEPIEILFLDVLKEPQLSEFAIRTYFPRLLPGQSIIVQQDYFVDDYPYITLHQEFFHDHFEYLGEIAPTAVFRCIRPVKASDIERLLKQPLPPQEQFDLVSRAEHRSLDPLRRLLVALSGVRLAHQFGGAAAARERMSALERVYAVQMGAPFQRIQDAVRTARNFCGEG
jgi:hypothetical protein